MGSRFFSFLSLIFSVFIYCLAMPFAQAQDMEVHIPWGKSWKMPAGERNILIPWFKGAVYPDPGQMLPRYIRVLPEIEAENIRAELKNMVYEPVPASDLEAFSLFDTAQHIPLLDVATASSAGKAYTTFSVIPFRWERGAALPERLVSFTLHMEYVPSAKSAMAQQAGNWKDASVFASGYWYKVKVSASGIYKLSYNKLLDLGISNPAGLKVYGNGGSHNPVLPGKRSKDDLVEIPVSFEKGVDGVFNAGDYVLLYLQGPGAFSYDAEKGMLLHQLHRNSSAAYYFLTYTDGEGTQLKTLSAETTPPTHTVTSYTATAWHEEELFNLIRSGSRWFGEKYDATTSRDFNFSFPGLVPGSTARIYTAVAGRYGSATAFTFSSGLSSLGVIAVSGVNTGSTTGNYASYGTGLFTFKPNSEGIPITAVYNKTEGTSAVGWLDFIDLNAECSLQLSGNQLAFRSLANIGAGQVASFVLGNATSKTRIWDVTDLNNPRQITGSLQDDQLTFVRASDSIREYIAFMPDADFQSPVTKGADVGTVSSQDLHGAGPADYVIITPPVFKPWAEELAAIHREKDQLRTLVATTTEIYNEFSSGAPDVTAYRDFMKMLYDKAGSDTDKPRYLLLFGDGSFDNRTTDDQNPNFILTYQSENSLTQNSSYVTDDYFGILDNNENEISGAMDIGVGRFPVFNTIQADSMVGKVRRYMDINNRGSWKNFLCFVGDDEDSGIHTEQADQLASDVETNYPGFVIEKIYLDAYQQQTSPSGQSYPDVNKAIYDRVHKGALIINYTGHGNENGLAHEKILQTNDIKSWTNGSLLPLFVTATCEFSRFDDVSIEGEAYSLKTSAGEEILLNTAGGGIGLLTTTRLVYSEPNFYLNEKFYHYVFSRNSNGDRLRLGDVLRLTKVNSGAGINKLNFTLLGDPAVTIDYPDQYIVADSVNGKPVGPDADTLRAFNKISIAGHFEDIHGNLLPDFSGEVYPILFDKALNLTTLDNDGEGAVNYNTYNSVLYRGMASVEHGRFDFSFIVPRDINYQVGEGKLVLYGKGGQHHAQGANKMLKIGSIDTVAIPDNMGPEIVLFLNDSTFVDGGVCSPDPVLKAWLYDKAGVNLTSGGIGHDIVVTLDEKERFVLNDYYESAIDDYSRGLVSYPLSGLDEGLHTLQFKVWDINNNSSVAQLSFRVTASGKLVIENLKNYPNPFYSNTTFVFNHNMGGEMLDVNLSVYSLSGGLVFTRDINMFNDGFSSQPVEWNGRNGNGARLPEGIYLYRIRAQGSDGQFAEKSGKLVILKE